MRRLLGVTNSPTSTASPSTVGSPPHIVADATIVKICSALLYCAYFTKTCSIYIYEESGNKYSNITLPNLIYCNI